MRSTLLSSEHDCDLHQPEGPQCKDNRTLAKQADNNNNDEAGSDIENDDGDNAIEYASDVDHGNASDGDEEMLSD